MSSHQLSCLEGASAVIVAGMWFSVFSRVKLSWGCIVLPAVAWRRIIDASLLFGNGMSFKLFSTTNEGREGAFVCTWQVRYNLCLNGFLSMQIAFAAMCSHQLSCAEGASAVIGKMNAHPWVCGTIKHNCCNELSPVKLSWGCICCDCGWNVVQCALTS